MVTTTGERLDFLESTYALKSEVRKHLDKLAAKVKKLETKPAQDQETTRTADLDNITKRLAALEQPVEGSVQSQLQELRVKSVDFDSDIERANARLSKLEKDFGDGINDGRPHRHRAASC